METGWRPASGSTGASGSGSSWGALRSVVVWQVLREAVAHLPTGPGGDSQAHVLDAGGGSGGFAVPLAELGHRVTVVDPSPDSLAALERRAIERGVADRVHGVQGDLSTVLDAVAPGSVDLALCHSVLEYTEDPSAGLAAVAAALRAGGLLSLLAANRAGFVLGRALAGHVEDAARALADPSGRCGPHDGVERRFDLDGLRGLLATAGLVVEAAHGVRVFSDLVPGSLLDGDPTTTDALVRLELAASTVPAFQGIATQLHLLAHKR